LDCYGARGTSFGHRRTWCNAMGTERIPAHRIQTTSGKLQPCRWCGKIPEGRRRTFCSDECVKQHCIRTRPGYAAKLVLERDHGICCMCGLDTVALYNRLEMMLWDLAKRNVEAGGVWCRQVSSRPFGEPVPSNCGHSYCIQSELSHWMSRDKRYRFTSIPEYSAACDAANVPTKLRRMTRRLWEMDHIIPVVEGGGDCGLENLRTLCISCHAKETADLAARRAAARRATIAR
jgi:5-methylcytosine-specific restriction endonuclease McrA